MNTECVTVDEVIVRLEALLDTRRASAIALDADGTLWSGDAAEDVFKWAVAHEAIRPEAKSELDRTAREHGIVPEPSPSRTAGVLFQSYLDGHFPELTVCEVMTWCFAGWTLGELGAMAREVLDQCRLSERLNQSLNPLLEWARNRKVRALVISASPQWIVEEAARHFGVEPHDVCGSPPRLSAGTVLPELAGPVPYAETKVDVGRAALGSARWLASFGDSSFDFEMLRAAELAVAVAAKPGLRARLPELENAVVLAD